MRNPTTVPAALTVLVLALFAAPAAAQVAPVEPTPEQVKLHGVGVAAAKAGRWDEAIATFEKSLALGDLNLTWLNLGRTYQYAGRCDEALAAYQHAIRAPKVAQPSPARVAQVIVAYRDELLTGCTGTLRLTCKPLNLKLLIDGEPSDACDGRPLTLAPGVHVLVASTTAEPREILFEIRPGQPLDLSVEIETRGTASLRKSFLPRISESTSDGILK